VIVLGKGHYSFSALLQEIYFWNMTLLFMSKLVE